MPRRCGCRCTGFSYDEEVGCTGVRSTVDFLRASAGKPALCIIGEPTDMRPVYGHKGKLAVRCRVEGHSCHSAYAPEGVNAISYAAADFPAGRAG